MTQSHSGTAGLQSYESRQASERDEIKRKIRKNVPISSAGT